MSNKSVGEEVSSKSVLQEQECLTRVSYKGSSKSVLQKRPESVSRKSVLQKCHVRSVK